MLRLLGGIRGTHGLQRLVVRVLDHYYNWAARQAAALARAFASPGMQLASLQLPRWLGGTRGAADALMPALPALRHLSALSLACPLEPGHVDGCFVPAALRELTMVTAMRRHTAMSQHTWLHNLGHVAGLASLALLGVRVDGGGLPITLRRLEVEGVANAGPLLQLTALAELRVRECTMPDHGVLEQLSALEQLQEVSMRSCTAAAWRSCVACRSHG